MSTVRSFKNRLAAIKRYWKAGEFGDALAGVDALRNDWPGNAHIETLWASLVQLHEDPNASLDDARRALERARELDGTSPVAAIELGHFVDNVDDDPRSAAKFFSEAVERGRALLIEGLLGQAKALLQLGKKDESYRCLLEVLHLKHFEPHAKQRGNRGTPVPT
jgi:tetratricopeptide (TPR) repeat protein